MAKKLKKRLKVIVKKRLKVIVKKRLKKKATTSEPSLPTKAMAVIAKDELLMGSYCNIASVSHTGREFILDFFFAMAGQNSLTSRVITSPQHVKKIYEVLGTNIEKYEKKFGEIKV